MAGTRYEVTDVVFETPRYLQVPGGLDPAPTPATGPPYSGSTLYGAEGEHDLVGSGWVEIADGVLTVAIRPAGILGHFEPREKRSYRLSSVTGWHVSGNVVEVTFGTAGPVAADGADAPAHLGTVKCASVEAAEALTAEARACGVAPRQPPRHSGL